MKKVYNEIVFTWDEFSESYIENSSDYYYVDEDAPFLMFGGGGDEGGGGSQQTQTVQKADPWEGQQPYLRFGFDEARRQYDSSSPQFYPGSTIVPNSPETELALSMQTNRALNGSPIQTAATNELTRTLSGDYLNPIQGLYNTPTMQASNDLTTRTLNGDYLYGGEGFNRAFDAAANRILPQVNSGFERAGRTGSGLASAAQTQALGDAFAGLYGQERNNQLQTQGMALANTNSLAQQMANERENQMRGMFFAPQIAQQDYADIGALADVGSAREGLNQAYLNEDINRFNYNQNLPAQKLFQYNNLINGNYGGTTNTLSTQPMYRNQGAGLLGGAMSGYSLANSLFPGYGLVGAVGGGLLGGLF